jgi:hypothetical protein
MENVGRKIDERQQVERCAAEEAIALFICGALARPFWRFWSVL